MTEERLAEIRHDLSIDGCEFYHPFGRELLAALDEARADRTFWRDKEKLDHALELSKLLIENQELRARVEELNSNLKSCIADIIEADLELAAAQRSLALSEAKMAEIQEFLLMPVEEDEADASGERSDLKEGE